MDIFEKIRDIVDDEMWDELSSSQMNKLHRAFDKAKQSLEAGRYETIVSNTVGIQLNDDFNGGKIVMDMDIWDVLKKFKGKTISAKNESVDIHIAIKE